jgi:chitinase
MKKNEESLKRLRKTKKPAFSLFGTSSNTDDEAKDEERIRAQMILDVEAFGKDARGLGVDLESNKHFKALKGVVYNTDTE